eukprot:1145460-Pleurochrysis_carterae.AAC.2
MKRERADKLAYYFHRCMRAYIKNGRWHVPRELRPFPASLRRWTEVKSLPKVRSSCVRCMPWVQV